MAKKRKKTASEATASDATDADDEEEAEEAEDTESDSDDEGNPTGDVTPGEDTQPDGQTAAGSAELGPAPAGDDDFADPVTNLDPLGTKKDTRVDDDGESKQKFPKSITALAKGMGLKKSNILGYNERTKVAVFDNGGKYQLSKKGDSVRHLAGPKPPADIDLGVVDARTRSPFTGTAAAINASVHANDNSALARRREDLARELAALDEAIEATA